MGILVPGVLRLRRSDHGSRTRLTRALLLAVCGASLVACGGPRLQPGIPRPTAHIPFIKAITDVAYTDSVLCTPASDQDLADIAKTGATWVVLGPVWNQVDLTSISIHPWIKTTTDACLRHAIPARRGSACPSRSSPTMTRKTTGGAR